MNLNNLPALNAILNGLAAAFLAAGYIFIRRKNQTAHRNCMIIAVLFSSAFLTAYVYYHYERQRVYGSAHTKFVEPAAFRPVYLTILVTHFLGAVAIVPLVIMTVVRAVRQRFELHKKIARWTWPTWMYVSVTGVLIYLLLYQVFPQSEP